MRTKESVFQEIQHILKYDYAGCRKPIDHAKFVVTNDMSDEAFIQLLEDYIAAFEDAQLSIQVKNDVRPNIGFSVRRYENELYVIEASEETRLHVGDRIIAIDDVPIADISHEEHIPIDRQQWQRVLQRANAITVLQRTGSVKIVLTQYRRKPYQPIYEARMMTDQCFYMKLTDFGESEPLQQLLMAHRDTLEQVAYLIVDMRQNYGGNDVYMYPLLDYVFDAPQSLKALYAEEVEYTNYTPRNCQLLLQMYDDYLREPLDEATVRALDHEMFEIEQHRGQGFVEVKQEADVLFEGAHMPKKVYVLTDMYCTGAGESFVALAKKSPKVTVVGRPTRGTMATFNVVAANFGDIALCYPVSIMDENSVFATNEGLKPDVYVPWTPAHLIEDRDIQFVLNAIK